jgi:hypothetical protein
MIVYNAVTGTSYRWTSPTFVAQNVKFHINGTCTYHTGSSRISSPPAL